MSKHDSLHQYPSVTKPWLRYYLKDFTRKVVPQCTVYEQMYSRNARIKDAVALVYGDKEITFGSLFREIESTAAAFSSLGVRSGDTVTICSFTIPEVVYSFYALNMLGVVCNFIDPRTNDERILHYIKECDSRVALVWEESISRFLSFQRNGALDKIILLSPSDSASRQDFCGSKQNNSDSSFLRWNTFRKGAIGATPIPYPYQKDYPAAILYTGGTTGIPKGVVLSNDALNTITVEYDECGIEYAVGQRFLNIMPPFVASGLVCGINMILGLGLASILVPKFHPDRFAELYVKYRPNHVLGVPSYYEKLFKAPEVQNMDFSFVGTISAGGDDLLPEVELKLNHFLRARQCKVDVVKGYGLTELGSAVTTTRNGVNKIGSVGIPLPLTTITIRNPKTREELPFHSEGEIYISSPSAMIGYLGAPEEEREVFWTDNQGTRWLKTGDIGYMDEDGFLFLQGRIKRMIIRPDGHNVWPSKIEEVIMQHPMVHQCVVVGIASSDTRSGKIPTAFIVTRDDAIEDLALMEEIDRYCRKHMPERDTATAYLFVKEIPLTAVGKVDYLELEQMMNKRKNHKNLG